MTLIQAIKQRKVSEIKKLASKAPIAEIANTIDELPDKEMILFFTLLKGKQQSRIFYSLESDSQEKIIKAFNNDQIKEIVDDIFADDIVDIMNDVPDDIAQKILKATKSEKRKSINKLLRYKDDQIGSFMTVDIITIKQNITAKEASKLIRHSRDEVRMSHYFFVTNSQNKLVGFIPLEELFFAKGDKKVKNLMEPVSFVTTTTNKEEASLIFADNDMSVLPVVNNKKEVIGMITSEDIIDVFQESATEDVEKMAGISSNKKIDIEYSKKTIFSIFRSRIFWLTWLMLSATLSEFVSQHFIDYVTKEGSLIAAAHLSSAIISIAPVIAGSAGNAGAQSSTTVIRALATGDIGTKDYLKVFWKEMRVALLVGSTLAIFNFIRLIIYYSAFGMMNQEMGIKVLFVSLSASLALFLVINVAKILGGLLPLVAKKIKLDPAIMSAPILTTILDALSLATFFSISIGIMSIVL